MCVWDRGKKMVEAMLQSGHYKMFLNYQNVYEECQMPQATVL